MNIYLHGRPHSCKHLPVHIIEQGHHPKQRYENPFIIFVSVHHYYFAHKDTENTKKFLCIPLFISCLKPIKFYTRIIFLFPYLLFPLTSPIITLEVLTPGFISPFEITIPFPHITAVVVTCAGKGNSPIFVHALLIVL